MYKNIVLEVDLEDLQDILDSLSHEMMVIEKRSNIDSLLNNHKYMNLKSLYFEFKDIKWYKILKELD